MPAAPTIRDWYYGAGGMGDMDRSMAVFQFSEVGGFDLQGFEAESYSIGRTVGRGAVSGVATVGGISSAAMVVALLVLLLFIHWAGTRGLD